MVIIINHYAIKHWIGFEEFRMNNRVLGKRCRSPESFRHLRLC